MSQSEPGPNPYADHSSVTTNSLPNFAARNESMVKQLPILAVLQIVLGLLELLMGSLLLFSAYFVPFAVALSEKKTPETPPIPKELLGIMVYYYLIVGGLALLFSILRIVSGVCCFLMRGRMLTIISLIGGLTTVFTVYCSLFSIGLAVYGMILMMHPAILQAFELAKSGLTLAQIRESFALARLRESQQ